MPLSSNAALRLSPLSHASTSGRLKLSFPIRSKVTVPLIRFSTNDLACLASTRSLPREDRSGHRLESSGVFKPASLTR